jgi:hypothetical protein
VLSLPVFGTTTTTLTTTTNNTNNHINNHQPTPTTTHHSADPRNPLNAEPELIEQLRAAAGAPAA